MQQALTKNTKKLESIIVRKVCAGCPIPERTVMNARPIPDFKDIANPA